MYDALDEYAVNQITDGVWQMLLHERPHATEIPHNALVALKKMELARQDARGFVYLTSQGRTYAKLIIAPPF